MFPLDLATRRMNRCCRTDHDRMKIAAVIADARDGFPQDGGMTASPDAP